MNKADVLNRVYESNLPSRAKTVMFYLINRSNKELTCFPAIPTIARETGLSESTFGEWLIDWLNTYSKPIVRKSTYISYETYIGAHIIPKLGDIKIKNLNTEKLQKFFNEKACGERLDNKKGGLSTKTLRNLKNMIHLALEQAKANELIVKNPITAVKLPKQQPTDMRVLSSDEQNELELVLGSSKEILAQGILVALFTRYTHRRAPRASVVRGGPARW